MQTCKHCERAEPRLTGWNNTVMMLHCHAQSHRSSELVSNKITSETCETPRQ